MVIEDAKAFTKPGRSPSNSGVCPQGLACTIMAVPKQSKSSRRRNGPNPDIGSGRQAVRRQGKRINLYPEGDRYEVVYKVVLAIWLGWIFFAVQPAVAHHSGAEFMIR